MPTFPPIIQPLRPTSRVSVDPLLATLAWLALGLAGLLAIAWLWSCWCSFPSNPWNDLRVAPAVALHRGISVYGSAETGPVNTWTYGPLPLLLLWPAGLAKSAIGAIEIAGALHIGLTVATLLLTCLCWPVAPAAPPAGSERLRRLAIALVCVLLVRNETSGYTVYNVDAPGIALSLLSLLALVRRRLWPAAFCAAAAAACKQTFLGVGLAQAVWLLLADSPRAAVGQAGRCVVAGLLIAGAAVAGFGTSGLWFVLVTLPARFLWAPPLARLAAHAGYLVWFVVLPLIALGFWRRQIFGRTSALLLPAVAFLCTLPFGLAAFFKGGGNVNSLHSFWLWFPPTLTVALSRPWFGRLAARGSLALALVPLALASCWLQLSFIRVSPNVGAYREATLLAARLPEKIWFPLHPLVTLYSDGRLYHDLDGLGVRRMVGLPVTARHFAAYMPRFRQANATLLPVGWGAADIADARLPPHTPTQTFLSWRIDGYLK